MDSSNLWWTDSELNNYLEDWQHRVQIEHNLVWGSATVTAAGTSTFTLTNFASDILRPGRLIHNARLLTPKTKHELLEIHPEWRLSTGAENPIIVYQESLDTITVWPPPTGTGTYVLEYPRELTFNSTDTSTMALPGFTKYSAKDYVAFRALSRRGPNNDNFKAAQYKQSFYGAMESYGIIKRRFMPRNFMHLRPGTDYQRRLADPIRSFIPNMAFPSDVAVTLFQDEVPSGTINGTNTVFTLTQTPSPALSLELNLDGVELVKDTHYTLLGGTITLTAGAPLTGQNLFAHYRYVA